MKDYQIIYDENKKLDSMFDELYNVHSIDIVEKNIVELLVEIGELANETKCFKYWSNKKPSDRHEIIEEYADCLLMSLYFCNMVDLDLDEYFDDVKEKDVIQQFKRVYNLTSQLNYELEKGLIKEILSNIVHLGKLLTLTKEEIIDGCLQKIEKNKRRFNTGF